MSGEASMLLALANASVLTIVVWALFGGGDDAEAHFVRGALAPSDVAGRQLL